MKGIVFLGNRKLELREFPDPTPGSGATSSMSTASTRIPNPSARRATARPVPPKPTTPIVSS